MRLDGALREVVLEQGVGECFVTEVATQRRGGLADLAYRRAVAVAVRAGGDAAVDAREFLATVIQPLLRHLAGGRVDDPPVERRGPCPLQSVETSKALGYWHTSATTWPPSS